MKCLKAIQSKGLDIKKVNGHGLPQYAKVDVPKTNTTITWTLVLERYEVRSGSYNWHSKDMCSKTNWTACSKYIN